ncbi:hypothetical protein N665_0026s0052 [Sinapis alba]|nr:hypothetical protein N665_0026s0052 [Sinapis alba]
MATKLKQTGKSAAKTPSLLPSQYEFVPRYTRPPSPPNHRSRPSVSDYLPPTQLFHASTSHITAASHPVPQDPPPPRPEQPPPSQSPVSSQAQNSDNTEGPEAESGQEPLQMEPNLFLKTK